MSDQMLGIWLLPAATIGFLCGFWLLPGDVLALRRRAHGEMQVDLRPGYSSDTLYRLLGLYGTDGVQAFRRMLLADMLFPVVYAALLVQIGNLVGHSHAAVPRTASFLRMAAIAAASFDYLENLFLLHVIRRLPSHRRLAAHAAGAFTSLKTFSLLGALVALVVMLLSPRAG